MKSITSILCALALAAPAVALAATECRPYTPTISVAAPASGLDAGALTVAAGTPVVLSAQGSRGSSWRWSGCGAGGSAPTWSFTAQASCVATVTVTDACGTSSTQSVAVTVPGMRDLDSVQLSRLMGAGWNLGNSLEATGGETAWGNPPVTQAMLLAVKAAGFRTVRIPVSWKQYADADDNIGAAWMARVTQVVDYARRAGLYTIINIHWDGGWMQPTWAAQAAVNARITKFWTQIANNFRGYDDMLLFAGTNEVMKEGDYGWPTFEYYTVQNSFNQAFVSAVRATGGNNLARHLIVQGYNTNIDFAVYFASLPTDSATRRLMMEVHFYDPYDFTLNRSSGIWQWGVNSTDPAASQSWADEAYVDAKFQMMKQRFVDQGVAVVLGEFAALRRAQDPAQLYRTDWARYVARSAWQHGMVPIWWDDGSTGIDTLGLFDRRAATRVHARLISAIVNAAR